jgi:hypothetical protein
VTRDEWVAAALAARKKQLGHVAIEDDEVLAVVAAALTRGKREHDEPAPRRVSGKD